MDYKNILEDITGIEVIDEPHQITKLSLDYYHFSPILQELLQHKRGDLVVRPTTEEHVLRIAKTCVKHRIPLTVRGAGTGNYGQCIPLRGGIILDTTRMNRIQWIKPGLVGVEPGVRMEALDKETRKTGWELRMVPSTYRSATIGGFIGGGSVGMGSITYGQLRSRGNLHALKVVTMEDEPRVIELRGEDVQKVNHAYGTNGIITAIEMPTAPVYPWMDMIAVFDEFMNAAQFAQALGDSDGIVKKLISVHAWPIPSYFNAIKSYLPEGKHCVLLVVSDTCRDSVKELIREFEGTVSEEEQVSNILEFTWNHTTLLARAIDPSLTYLQTFYFDLDRVEHMYKHFGEEVMIHLEFIRNEGKTIPAGLQLVRYTTPERLQAIMDYHEEKGAAIANPHTYFLEGGGRKVVDEKQLAFKRMVDPYGLLNPGKMSAYVE